MNKTVITETERYLSFRLGEEVFALNVLQVLEVLDLCPITKVPRAPDFMRGIINVRGSVIPVLDLRMKFGKAQAEETLDTRIIVMQIVMDGDMIMVGAIADAVHEVLEIEPEYIEAAPKIGSRWQTEFIKGIGKRDEEFIIILDIDRVFSSNEMIMVQQNDGHEENLVQAEAAV